MLRRVLAVVLALGVWAVVAVPVWWGLMAVSSEQLNVAGHDAVVSPTVDGYATVRMGPYLPDARLTTGAPFGAEIVLGKTEAATGPAIIARYGVLAARPQAEIRAIKQSIEDQVATAAARAAVIGLVPLGLWALLGPVRRRALLRPSRRMGVLALMLVTALAVVLVAPWRDRPEVSAEGNWTPLPQALPQMAVPAELATIEVRGDAMTGATARLVESGFDTFDKSKIFYDKVRENVVANAELLREPAEDETVGILVSDRHNNVGMDPVAATIGNEAGATVVLDAGDDTSSGASWETFSLDSLDEAFEGYRSKVVATGNHDHGNVVGKHFRALGWRVLDGRPATLFDGVRISGLKDPRSSGLGNWRDEKGLSFAEVQERFSKELCRLNDKDQRIATVLVHDANLARSAYQDGCVDLVVGGHVHTASGPTPSEGPEGTSWTYTNGTTGGAAYAWAMGSKLRREAMVTLITWRDGRPVGLQPVTIQTTGNVVVGEFTELTY